MEDLKIEEAMNEKEGQMINKKKPFNLIFVFLIALCFAPSAASMFTATPIAFYSAVPIFLVTYGIWIFPVLSRNNIFLYPISAPDALHMDHEVLYHFIHGYAIALLVAYIVAILVVLVLWRKSEKSGKGKFAAYLISVILSVLSIPYQVGYFFDPKFSVVGKVYIAVYFIAVIAFFAVVTLRLIKDKKK